MVVRTGQPILAGVDNDVLKKADKAFAAQQFALAADLYVQVLQHKPAHKLAAYRLGLCYLELSEPSKAKRYLHKAYELDPLVAEDILVAIGDAHHLASDFEEAITYFRKELARAARRDMENIALLQKRIYECEAGIVLSELPPVAEVANAGAGINSELSDYVPVLLPGDTAMVYTTRRLSANGLAAGVEQMRISRLKNGEWQPSEQFLQSESKLQHHAVVSVSPNGQQLYTYYSGKGGGLFCLKWQGSDWSTPERLGKPFNRGAAELSVHVTDDGKFAFFSSDREGGYGGLDLYVCYKKTDGTWSEALNLGPNINTSFDEDAPFADVTTNTLYFSSRGHNSIGGFDIFKSRISSSEWSKAENVGMPVNSPFDDIYFTLDNSLKRGYFSSDRPGGFGAKDIYSINF